MYLMTPVARPDQGTTTQYGLLWLPPKRANEILDELEYLRKLNRDRPYLQQIRFKEVYGAHVMMFRDPLAALARLYEQHGGRGNAIVPLNPLLDPRRHHLPETTGVMTDFLVTNVHELLLCVTSDTVWWQLLRPAPYEAEPSTWETAELSREYLYDLAAGVEPQPPADMQINIRPTTETGRWSSSNPPLSATGRSQTREPQIQDVVRPILRVLPERRADAAPATDPISGRPVQRGRTLAEVFAEEERQEPMPQNMQEALAWSQRVADQTQSYRAALQGQIRRLAADVVHPADLG